MNKIRTYKKKIDGTIWVENDVLGVMPVIRAMPEDELIIFPKDHVEAVHAACFILRKQGHVVSSKRVIFHGESYYQVTKKAQPISLKELTWKDMNEIWLIFEALVREEKALKREDPYPEYLIGTQAYFTEVLNRFLQKRNNHD